MHSQPDDGSDDGRRREPDSPRHQPSENHSIETDGKDTPDTRDGKPVRGTTRRAGLVSYGITAVTLTGVVLILEREFVPVSESALSWATIAGAATMMLIALTRYTRRRSRQSVE